MSLSWLDRLTLLIHPQRVVLERQPWRGALQSQALELAPALTGEADWQPALNAAQRLLAAAGKGSTLRIVVADPFVRYALLPWSAAISGKKQRLALAQTLLRNVLGEKAQALEIVLDRPAFNKNGLAAGIDRALIDGLRRAAQARRLRLSSIQPRLIAELSAKRQQLSDGWFVSVDHDWLSLVGLHDDDLRLLRNHRIATADPAALASELAGLLASGIAAVDSKKLFISSGQAALPTLAGDWQTIHWPSAVYRAAHA